MSDPQVHIDVDMTGAERCRREGGLAFFVKEFWSEIVPDELVWTPHMQVLCDEIQESDERVFLRLPKIHDKIFNVPPGTSKTLILSIFSTAWELARDPRLRVFVGSFSDDAVSDMADKIKLVMKSAKYRRWFPHSMIRRDRDTLHNFKTTHNGEFYAFTVGGTITSKHAHILKIDDPIDPKGAASDAELKTACNFFDQTLPMRKVNKLVTITYVIMQRLSDKDPTAHLLEKKKGNIRHIKLPGVAIPGNGNVLPEEYEKIYIPITLPDDHSLAKRYGHTTLLFLDHVRNGPQAMADSLQDLQSYGYAGQIDQEPSPSDGEVWKKWFLEIPDHSWPDFERATGLGTDWDLAYTKKKKNAASAYITSFKYNNRIYLDDFDWRWLEFPELIKWMKTKRPAHYIEAKASGISAKQTLSSKGVVAIEVKVKGGEDKVARARMATPVAESGIVCIRKSMADRMYNDPQQGILKFPNAKFKDLADVLAQCLQRHNIKGMTYHQDREEEEEEMDEDLLDQLNF